jgi:hypothetical protein
MDLIRETLMYKNNVLHVCMNTLTRQEQYEFLRLIIATRKDVTFCYDNSNSYILCIIEKIGLERIICEKQQQVKLLD